MWSNEWEMNSFSTQLYEEFFLALFWIIQLSSVHTVQFTSHNWMPTITVIMSSYSRRIFFSIKVLFQKHSRITGPQGKGEGISWTPHYHFHPVHRHLGISRTITADSSPLHITSSRTRTGKLCFLSASR